MASENRWTVRPKICTLQIWEFSDLENVLFCITTVALQQRTYSTENLIFLFLVSLTRFVVTQVHWGKIGSLECIQTTLGIFQNSTVDTNHFSFVTTQLCYNEAERLQRETKVKRHGKGLIPKGKKKETPQTSQRSGTKKATDANAGTTWKG